MKLYSNLEDRKTYVEFWGASTKHPDAIHCLQDDIEKEKFTPFFPDAKNFGEKKGLYLCDLIQWLFYIASIKTWVFHAVPVAEIAIEWYTEYGGNAKGDI